LHLKNVWADTNNGGAAVHHKNHKNPPKSWFRQLQLTAMVGIAPGYRHGLNLDSGACQPSRQVVGAADSSFAFEERAADTNNGDEAVYHNNHKNPPKTCPPERSVGGFPFRQSEHAAMVGIAP
jgi:hypothetical protein